MIHHVELYTNDLKTTRDFWEWFLGLLDYKVYQEWDEGFSMIFDQTYIVFVQVEDRFCGMKYHRCGPGLNHLAFAVDTGEKVDEIYDRVKEKGMKVLYEDRHPYAGGKGYYALYFEDPMRMKVEVVAKNA